MSSRSRPLSFARQQVWLAVGVAIAISLILSTGVLGAAAGAILGRHGTALVGLLITGFASWIGALMALAAPKATFAAGPLKGSGLVGRLVVAAFGLAFFAWGTFNAAELTVDAIRDPLIADVSVERVLISSCSRCMESEVLTLEGPRYMTVYGWKIWAAVPSRTRLFLGAETGRVLWLEAR